MYSVIIVDDEALMCATISDFIRQELPLFHVAARFYDGLDARTYLEHNPVDVVITDIRMLRLSGLDLAQYIRDQHPQTAVIIISGYSDFHFAKKAIRFGVKNYILKPIDFGELKSSFEQVRTELDARNAQKPRAALPDLPQNSPDESTAQNRKKQIVQLAQNYIQLHYCENISRGNVASAVYISDSYLSHIFLEITGISYMDYITKLRMEKAIELLQSGCKINEIALRVGYSSRKPFLTAFHKYTSRTPSQYLLELNQQKR